MYLCRDTRELRTADISVELVRGLPTHIKSTKSLIRRRNATCIGREHRFHLPVLVISVVLMPQYTSTGMLACTHYRYRDARTHIGLLAYISYTHAHTYIHKLINLCSKPSFFSKLTNIVIAKQRYRFFFCCFCFEMGLYRCCKYLDHDVLFTNYITRGYSIVQ